MANDADLVIVGGGPCGLAAAVSAQRAGLRAQVIESGVVVSTIAAYPIYARFFSTAEKLSIGGLPFVIATEKPTRRDALAYYRAVVSYFGIALRQRERVTAIQGWSGEFTVVSRTAGGEESKTRAGAVVIATGYFGSPNRIGVPGEDLPHVTHVYHVKWDSRIKSIEPRDVLLTTGKHDVRLKADRVYIMTGFAPSLDLLRESGVPINPKTGIPDHDPNTLETPIPGLFIAGVVVAGYDANKVFIENGRFHGDRIVARLLGQRAPAEPKLSPELDA